MQILNQPSGQSNGKSDGFSLYQFEKKSKSLVSVPSGSSNIHRFIYGTFEDSELNEVRLVDFEEESFSFSVNNSILNLKPVEQLLDLYSDDKNTQLLVSFRDTLKKESFLSVLKVDSEKSGKQTDYLTDNKVKGSFKNLRRLSLDPHSSQDSTRFSVVTEDTLYIYKNFEDDYKVVVDKEPSDKYSKSFFTSKFDPHNRDLLSFSTDNWFEVLDLRQDSVNKLRVKSPSYHKGTILDLNYNPNVPNEVTTTGEDSLVLFWDLRNTCKPLESFDSCHSHWVKRVEYNLFHDQLLLTCGSSGSFLHMRKDNLEKVSQKPDSCNDICWSYDEAWFYCSLLTNCLRVETVPKELKSSLLS